MEFVKPDTSHVAIFLFHEALRRSKATEAAQFKIAERWGLTLDFALVPYSLPSFLADFFAF